MRHFVLRQAQAPLPSTAGLLTLHVGCCCFCCALIIRDLLICILPTVSVNLHSRNQVAREGSVCSVAICSSGVARFARGLRLHCLQKPSLYLP